MNKNLGDVIGKLNEKKDAKPKEEMPPVYKGESTALGMGGRFEWEVDQVKKNNPSYSDEQARATVAKIGRAKYGKGKFQEMASSQKKKEAKAGHKL
jgi:hypothetical protein